MLKELRSIHRTECFAAVFSGFAFLAYWFLPFFAPCKPSREWLILSVCGFFFFAWQARGTREMIREGESMDRE